MTLHIQHAIHTLQSGGTISAVEAERVFSEIMRGKATPAQIGALLMGLTIRGETPEVITGAARAMRLAATRIHPKSRGLLDTCGTGGDGASTFNISTTVALVVASAGQKVAKHGNRAVSSRSGSADVLEVLGVNIQLPPEKVAECVDKIGIGFLFAPGHHPAMKHAAGPRRDLGIRSIFNLLGPLSNPADAEYQVVGVFAKDKLDLVANALLQLGSVRALVVHGRDGMDEISTTTISDAILVEKAHPLRRFEIDPRAFGIPYASAEDLAGADVDENASIIMEILSGKGGPRRDIVLLNAAAALWICGRVEGIPQGLKLAAECIDTGRACEKLQALIDFTQEA